MGCLYFSSLLSPVLATVRDDGCRRGQAGRDLNGALASAMRRMRNGSRVVALDSVPSLDGLVSPLVWGYLS